MLTKTKIQEIQDLKLQGYTKADIIRYYEAQGRKPPSRPTISKYYDMDVIPDDPGAKLAKPKTFDAEPFRSTIIRILETNSGKSFCMSSVYDALEEKFIARQVQRADRMFLIHFEDFVHQQHGRTMRQDLHDLFFIQHISYTSFSSSASDFINLMLFYSR